MHTGVQDEGIFCIGNTIRRVIVNGVVYGSRAASSFDIQCVVRFQKQKAVVLQDRIRIRGGEILQ